MTASNRTNERPFRVISTVALGSLLVPVLLLGGCPDPNASTDGNPPVYNNTTDPTNAGATYINSAACRACHPDVADKTQYHAHSFALNPIQGSAPQYPDVATRAGVPNPPDGKTWADIAYVISGYLHCAYFIDADGYLMTTGVDGVDTKYVLAFPANGTSAHFASFLPDQAEPKPYDFEECFRCHTTGPMPQDPDHPRSQDGRPGIHGTWAEPGVMCEACHGPGSNHAPNPQRRDIYLDPTPKTCGRCHTAGDDPNVIVVNGGFMDTNTQYPQLLASGGHSKFNCTVCHDPHASLDYDRERGLRNECTDCHVDQNLAFHEGYKFVWGDYEEVVDCESCHMPLAAKSTSEASPDVVGDDARIADTPAHIFRIDTENARYTSFITDDGTAVRKDADGLAALTADYVCLRCHHGAGNVFALTPEGALRIVKNMHANAAAAE